MKSVNIKRLAAIGVGAALVGSAIAPLAYAGVLSNVDTLAKADVVDATGAPVVSVVAGSEAQVSDWVWAGNIAAKVAQLATVEKAVAVTGGGTVSSADATVDFSVGGTVTVKGGKTYFNNLLSPAQESQFDTQTVTNSSIPSLVYQGSKTFTVNGSSSTITMQEQVLFTVDTEFDETITNQALVGTITTANLLYRVDLGSGIGATENPTAGGAAPFKDDANDDVRIPFFGAEYLVNNVDKDSSPRRIVLIRAGEEKTYKEGDEITDLKGRDGKLYKVVVGVGSTISSRVHINLKLFDDQGTVVKEENFPAGDVIFYSASGVPVLETLVNIKDILSISTEGGGTIYRPIILLGTNRIEIRDATGFPFDSTKSASDYDWTAALTFSSDLNYLTRIAIRNSSQNQWSGAKALRAGQSAALPEGYGTLKLVGLQLPEFTGATTTQRVTKVVVGDQALKYRDNTQEADHTVPFYYLFQGISSGTTNIPLAFDTKTLYMDVNLLNRSDLNIANTAFTNTRSRFNRVDITDLNVLQTNYRVEFLDSNAFARYADTNRGNANAASTGYVNIGGQHFVIADTNDDINSENSWLALSYDANLSFKTTTSGAPFENWFAVDKNVSSRRDTNTSGRVTFSAVSFQGASDVNANYAVMVDETTAGTVANIWLMLAYQVFTVQYGKRVTFEGTDIAEGGRVDGNSVFYEPNSSQLPTDYNGGTRYNINNYKIAEFTVEEDEEVAAGIKDINLWVDTTAGNGDLVALPNAQLSTYTSQVLYDSNRLRGTGAASFRVDEGQAQFPDDGYTDFATRMTVKNNVATIVLPENRAQFEVLIEGKTVTREVSGGESFTGVKAGETKATDQGTKVTIEKVTVGKTTVEGATASPSTYKQVVPVGRLVYTDSVAPAGNKIIVGGYLVNSLAVGLALSQGTIEEALTADGDRVAELLPNGDIVVAGYTADDTVQAAKDLIAQLDTLIG